MQQLRVVIETDNPDAYDQLLRRLEASLPDTDDAGTVYDTEVTVTEHVFEGMPARRTWMSAVYQPDQTTP
jgi:hypothetical protein